MSDTIWEVVQIKLLEDKDELIKQLTKNCYVQPNCRLLTEDICDYVGKYVDVMVNYSIFDLWNTDYIETNAFQFYLPFVDGWLSSSTMFDADSFNKAMKSIKWVKVSDKTKQWNGLTPDNYKEWKEKHKMNGLEKVTLVFLDFF